MNSFTVTLLLPEQKVLIQHNELTDWLKSENNIVELRGLKLLVFFTACELEN